MRFDTVNLSMRYGLTRRLNLNASLPWYRIESAKFQGAPYTRLNRGVGDLVLTAEYSFGSAPQVTLEAGAEFPTGDIDRKDEFGQRICDILALGSGTVDPIVGMSAWVPHAFGDRLDVYATLRHRFSGGENKYGYRFGDQTTLSMSGYRMLGETWRGGVEVLLYHLQRDTWYGLTVPERGGTFAYVRPTLSTEVTPTTSIGVYVRAPVYMEIEGAQMVAEYSAGLEVTSDVTDVLARLRAGEDE